jgi:RHS repeat-associated protein
MKLLPLSALHAHIKTTSRRCFSASMLGAVLCLTLVQVLWTAPALADSCRESGGNQTCIAPKTVVGDWSYYVYKCSRAFAESTPFDDAVCLISGGIPNADSCDGGHMTDDLIGPAVASGWKTWDSACTMNASPGAWGATLNSSVCSAVYDPGDQNGTTYTYGVETSSNKVVPASGTKTTQNGCVQVDDHTQPGAAFASRTRPVTLACPLIGGCQGYQDNTCPVGHPIRPGTGAKVFAETDFTVANSGLRLVRYYNSQGFFRPQGSFAASTGSLGDFWRTNYDRHIYSIAGSSYVSAAAQRPDGSVKYFNSVGVEVQHFNGYAADTLTPISGGGWTLKRGDDEIETYSANGYLTGLWDKNNFQQTLTYDSNSRLSTVSDTPRGHSLNFTYTGNVQTYSGGTVTATATDGTAFLYSLDDRGNLTSVTYPGTVLRKYFYENANFVNALTGIQDENGVRFETIDYDTLGRAKDSFLAPGVASNTIGLNTFTYNADGSVTVVDPLSGTSTLTFSTINGVVNAATATQQCSSCGASTSKSRVYDNAGYIQSTTDFNNNLTTYAYDDTRGLELQRVEASGTPSQRTTITTPDPTFNVPDLRSIVNASGVVTGTETLTKWFYNTRGQALYRCEIDPAVSAASNYACNSSGNAPAGVRKWSYTYCETGCPLVGLLQSVDGPRTDVSDVTTYTYYSGTDLSHCADLGGICHYNGDLQKVTNALGQMTTYVSYDKNSRVTRTQDVNGVYTDMTYHARGWLLTRTVRANVNGTPNSSLDATTTFTYDNVGNVTKITQPEVPPTIGSYLAYTYDAAHRLIKITDNLGDTIDFCPDGAGGAKCLDAAGNRIDEQTKDPGGNLKRELSRQYDLLNRLQKTFNSLGTAVQSYTAPPEGPVSDGYDGNGNAIYSIDGTSSHIGTEQQYDPLNRLVKTLQDHAGSGATHDTTTQYAYDARNNLRSVIDPDTLTTSYTYDGLNNLTGLNSPDTGSTGYTYDAVGNRKTQTDAAGVISTFSYDALNRLAAISYPTTSLNITYAYDQVVAGCSNIGRLTFMMDHAGSTSYCYDGRGNVLKKIQTTADGTTSFVTQYQYTLADRLASLAYASGAIVTYGRDSVGRITSVAYKANATASSINLIGSATYLPFGPLNALNFGNGRSLTKTYDQDYAIDKVASSSSTGLVVDATVDVMGNVTSASSTLGSAPTQRFQYDPLYRLTDIQSGRALSQLSFSYDSTGDRLSKTPQGQSAQIYTYTPGSHHLASVAGVSRSYDPNGNTTQLNGITLTYDNRNRVTGKSPGGSTIFDYNGRGERVTKTTFQINQGPGLPTGARAYVYLEGGAMQGEFAAYMQCVTSSPQSLSKALPKSVQACPPGYYAATVWQPVADYIYLDGTPIGFATGGTLYYVETDQLGTPRQVIKPGATTAADTLMWKWDYFANNSAFGENTPSPQTITFNLRFPGQYFDSETGLNYNYFRDYEAGTGRYVESDPIGLKGGVSTYGYVLGQPLRYIDTTGLDVQFCCRGIDFPLGWFGYHHCYFKVNGSTYGMYPETVYDVGTLGVPSPNNPKDTGGECKPCKAKQPCSDPAKCIKDASDSYPVGAYGGLSHNSNTFAGSIARKCCDGGVPPGLGNAPGIDDNPPLGFHP